MDTNLLSLYLLAPKYNATLSILSNDNDMDINPCLYYLRNGCILAHDSLSNKTALIVCFNGMYIKCDNCKPAVMKDVIMISIQAPLQVSHIQMPVTIL